MRKSGWPVKRPAAGLAETSVAGMIGASAAGAAACVLALLALLAQALTGHFGRDYASRTCQHAPAEQHAEPRDRAAQVGSRSDVAETDGRHRRDRPVDRHRDAGEAVFWPLDQVH